MTNWEKYFGSPEKAALTLSDLQLEISNGSATDLADGLRLVADAPFDSTCMRGLGTLEWLQEESE